ncbi:MAG: glycoside hydrolase family 3 protein [Aggregatilineales bacterium]
MNPMEMNVRQVLNSMTLDEKIGQLFLLAFAKDRLDEARILFQDFFVGASYISNDNIPDPASATSLTSKLQQYAASTRLQIPLLLGVDQEGAWGVMVPESCTGPGNLALGATHSLHDVSRMYRVIGEELAAVGLNTLLAPCADCNSNPSNSIIGMRSFGEKPALVGALTAAAVQGAHEGGAAVSIKHFPGHGDTTIDSHRGLPTVSRTREALFKIDLYPFVQGIRAGADIVMTAHIVFTALDPENPATLSSIILQGVLRGEMGFEGVVLSDSMNMHSMKRNYRPEDSAVRALQAGVDLIMLAEEHYDHDASRYLQQQTGLLRAVKAAVEQGKLEMSRIDRSVERVLTLKRNRGLSNSSGPSPSAVSVVGSADHRAVELDVSRHAVAILRNKHNLVPIADDTSVTIINTTLRSSYAQLGATRGIGPNQTLPAFDSFVEVVRGKFRNIKVFSAETILSENIVFDVAERIIAVTENYPLPGMDFDQASQLQILRTLSEQYREHLIVAALRDPYELSSLPDVDTYVCAFSFRPSAVQAIAGVLSGEYTATGKTPLTLPNTEFQANEAIR